MSVDPGSRGWNDHTHRFPWQQTLDVAGVPSTLNLQSASGYAIVGGKISSMLAANCYVLPDGNWNRIDVALPASILQVNGDGRTLFYYAAAGANPILTWTSITVVHQVVGAPIGESRELAFLQAAPTASTTSTSPVAMASPFNSVSFTTLGGLVEFTGVFHMFNTGGAGVLDYVGFGVDGGGMTLYLNAQISPGANYWRSFPFFYRHSGFGAGAHTAQFFWQTSGGTLTNNNGLYSMVRVREFLA